jgi:hypothetical protein
MKKLLLTLASLALLSTSLYAGCTADVDMGGNKITDLGTPTNSKDAVTKEYVDAKYSPSPTYETGFSTQGGTSNQVTKMGNICIWNSGIKSDNAVTATTYKLVATLPSGYRPISYVVGGLRSGTTGNGEGYFRIAPSTGLVQISPQSNMAAGEFYFVDISYRCQ